jgi:hypothetical protein
MQRAYEPPPIQLTVNQAAGVAELEHAAAVQPAKPIRLPLQLVGLLDCSTARLESKVVTATLHVCDC